MADRACGERGVRTSFAHETYESCTRVSGEKTYSAAVMRVLVDFVRRAKARQILELRGSGLWEGALAEMLRDRKRKMRAT